MIPDPRAPALAALVAAALVAVAVASAAAWRAQRSVPTRRRLTAGDHPAPPEWFLAVVGSCGLGLAPEPAWIGARWIVAAAAATAALRWPQALLAAGAAAVVAHRVRRRARGRAERRSFDAHLVSAIDAMAGSLATGTSLALAIGAAAGGPPPAGPDLARVVRWHRNGLPLQVAVDRWAGERATPGARLLADALALAGRSGGSQRQALLGVQATLREREALAREVRALSSQARTSAAVLAVTPLAFAGVVAVVDHRVAAFYGTPAGWGCVLVGLGLDAMGALWMHRLTEAAA